MTDSYDDHDNARGGPVSFFLFFFISFVSFVRLSPSFFYSVTNRPSVIIRMTDLQVVIRFITYFFYSNYIYPTTIIAAFFFFSQSHFQQNTRTRTFVLTFSTVFSQVFGFTNIYIMLRATVQIN